MTCDSTNGCYAVTEYPKIGLLEYGRVIGDLNIQKEIMTRGPVACYLNYECIETYQVFPYLTIDS